MNTRWIAWLLVGVLTLACLAAPFSPVAGDTNGDQQVDVLDLQKVIAQVLSGAGADRRNDTNGDGEVNVLDLQHILDRAQSPEPEKKESRLSTERRAVVFSRDLQPARFFPIGIFARVHIESSGQEDHAAAECLGIPHRPPRFARYEYHLVPHAPPLSRAAC